MLPLPIVSSRASVGRDMSVLLWICVVLWSPPALGSDWWPFNTLKSRVERLLDEARDARLKNEWFAAKQRLLEASRLMEGQDARIIYEQGLLAYAMGEPEQAAELLQIAADLDPQSEARRDRAAILVNLGRWPEAVQVLRQAFDERSSSLRADQIMHDPQFRPLAAFAPYQSLLQAVREEQAGPFGRLLLKLEQLEASARQVERAFDRIVITGQAVSRLTTATGAKTIAYVLLSLLLSFGFFQLGVLQPPWTLLCGMGVAGAIWHFGARVATLGEADGASTIGNGAAWILGVWGVMHGFRWTWRKLRGVPKGADPFAAPYRPRVAKQLERVLALVHELDREGQEANARRKLRQEALELAAMLAVSNKEEQKDPQEAGS